MGEFEATAGSSAMVFVRAGAFLAWRALSPTWFGSPSRNPLLWAFFLLYAAAALATNEDAQGQAHFFGFAYGVGWGLARECVPVCWRRRFAPLAIGRYVTSGAVTTFRAVRQEPVETTGAMRPLMDGRAPSGIRERDLLGLGNPRRCAARSSRAGGR